MVAVLLSASSGITAAAPSEKVVYSFTGRPLGAIPEAGLIFDTQGNLYGTTVYGGTGSQCSIGCGTIFALRPQGPARWYEIVLHSFNLSIDGAYPSNPLVFDPAGNLYGTTQVGGDQGEAFGLIRGAQAWQFKLLHIFHGNRDGQQPRAGLVFDSGGNLYGTTVAGGSGSSGGNGTVFELSPRSHGWTEAILDRFLSGKRGASPQAPLIFDTGNLYGTTSDGGNPACPTGCGTAFELMRTAHGGWTERVLHEFAGSDGATPVAGLIADSAGNLYGTADQGGASGCFAGCGTVFELSPRKNGSWTFSLLHVFRTAGGGGPEGNLALDGAGNLYGTTVIGGNVRACPQQDGCGVAFKLAPLGHGKWAYSVLHKFNNGLDGALPTGVVIDHQRNLYGTTIGGGASSLGTVFEVTP